MMFYHIMWCLFIPFLDQTNSSSDPSQILILRFPIPRVRIQFSFVQFLLLCYDFCILSKTECKSIYYHFWRDHESSSFGKLARNEWICPEIWDFFVIKTLFTFNISTFSSAATVARLRLRVWFNFWKMIFEFS